LDETALAVEMLAGVNVAEQSIKRLDLGIGISRIP
jgi:hypothetical protein